MTTPSAHGQLGDGVAVCLCPKINHIALANRREVYDEIAGWWDAAP